MKEGGKMTLDKLPIGEKGMGLIPGTEVMVRKVAPMGDPIEIHIRGYELTIRIEDARNIELAPKGQEVAG